MSRVSLRVGILTFHWAANYGAVLQAYALQRVLGQAGFDTEIIDYVPYRVYLAQALHRIRSREFRVFLKEYRTRRFIRGYSAVSPRLIVTSRGVSRVGNRYDCVVVGSDQIWNENLTLTGEKGPLGAYFLDGVAAPTRRVAYAASLGAVAVSEKYAAFVGPLLLKFESLGVREASGARIVEGLGVRATLVLDPTLLLEREQFEPLIPSNIGASSGKTVSYILHHQGDELLRTAELAVLSLGDGEIVRLERSALGVGDWLGVLRGAGFVITNSYHAVVFCIHFGVPFLVVPVSGAVSGMNDRMDTLLATVGLEGRMLRDTDCITARRVASSPIDWISVRDRMSAARSVSLDFLLASVRGRD